MDINVIWNLISCCPISVHILHDTLEVIKSLNLKTIALFRAHRFAG